MNASKNLPLLVSINRNYSDIYLAEAYNLEAYLASSIATVRTGKTGMAFLLDEKCQLIAHTDQKLLAGKQRTNLSHYSPVKALLAGKSGAFYFTEQQGVKWLSHLKKLDSGWGVVILQQEAEALEKVHLFWHLVMTITAIEILVVGSLTWILTSRLVRPIEQLTWAT